MGLSKLGRYDIVRVLGRGAMGTVYEARDPDLERRVAIKTIAVQGLSPEGVADYEARFRTEARSAARLQHPHIVSVYDSGRDGETAYIVMEYVEGDDLKHHLGRGATFTLDQTLRIMRDLLAALDYAHARNIVHRDVKPANLLIEADGRVKLTDFGVARIQDAGDATRTRGTMVGTLKYMAPEQVQGQAVDARADLFSAGIVLYELLTARQPFRGDNEFALIAQIIGVDPPAPSTVQPALPASIDAVLARALAKSPAQRYGSARAFQQALIDACDQAQDLSTAPMPLGSASGSDPAPSRGNASGSGASVAARTVSTVTQELELVYWKDVRDSDDALDLQGFLDRFPDGIYADLARRRLRRLGIVFVGEQTATRAEPRVPAHADGDRAPGLPAPATAVLATGAPALGTGGARRRAVQMRTTVIAVAMLAAIAAVWLLGGPDSRPAVPAAAVEPPGVLSPPAADAGHALPQPVAAPAVTSPGKVPPAPAATGTQGVPDPVHAPAGRNGAAAARTTAAGPAPAAPAARSEAATPSTVAASPAAPVGPVAGEAGPEQACADRVLLGYQICLNEQCAKPLYAGHPVCEKRRAAERARKQQQADRN